MTNEQAVKYWTQKYNAAINFYDEHWDAEERHAHRDYVEAMEKAISALETVITAIDKWNKRGADNETD